MYLDKVKVIVDDENGEGCKFTWIDGELLLEQILYKMYEWEDSLITSAIQSAEDSFQEYRKKKAK